MKIFLTFLICFCSLLTFSQKNKKRYYPLNFIMIPENSVRIDSVIYHVSPFYFYETEVSNAEYLKFLNSLLEKNKAEEYLSAFPDSTKWKFKDISFKEYFTSKQYRNYPVVCISYDKAMMFCKWLENQINTKNSPTFQVQVRLPNEYEWMSAAYVYENMIYACFLLVNGKNYYLTNFKNVSEQNIKKGLLPVLPVKSFNPNDFGLYNLNGNLSEMLLEEGKTKGGHWDSNETGLLISSVEYFNGPSVKVGFRPMMVQKK